MKRAENDFLEVDFIGVQEFWFSEVLLVLCGVFPTQGAKPNLGQVRLQQSKGMLPFELSSSN